MSIQVNEFYHKPGENDAEYIKLLKEALERQTRLTSKAISKLKEKHEWVSVKDRLPDRNTQYLIALSTGGVTSGWYFGDCGGFFVAGVCITENVSYWQQLPEPPKED